jgi:hypothetical protein
LHRELIEGKSRQTIRTRPVSTSSAFTRGQTSRWNEAQWPQVIE